MKCFTFALGFLSVYVVGQRQIQLKYYSTVTEFQIDT